MNKRCAVALVDVNNSSPLLYGWAETVQYFSRVQHLTNLFPFHTVMCASGPAEAVDGTTHWAQDKAAKFSQ